MQYQEFLNLTAEKIAPGTASEVRKFIAVTLSTLGERLYRTGRDELSAQLPKELKGDLYLEVDGEAVRTDTERFPLEEYYQRVAARADLPYPRAVEISRKVMEVLAGAVTPEVLAAVKSRLPEEYDQLFGDAPDSPTSPTAV